jgi:hypothetical protein
VDKIENALAQQTFRGITKSRLKGPIGEPQDPIRAENCDEFAGGIDQSRKLLSLKN